MCRSPWFAVFKRNPRARVRLFCFHYAGGSVSVFRDWPLALPEEAELLAVRLPGHVGRHAEPLITRAEVLVSRLYQEMLPYIDIPYCLFGHSMGALLAYELASLLQQHGHRPPDHIVVSARRAPHLPPTDQPCSELPQDELIERLREYGGTSEEIFRCGDLVPLLLPIWRADFAISDNYVHRAREPLRCALLALGGRDDKWVSEEAIHAWRPYSALQFSSHIFQGGHFFLNERAAEAELLRGMSAVLRAAASNGAATSVKSTAARR